MAVHQDCEYNCGATDCEAPPNPRAKDQAQKELNQEELREAIDKYKRKIVEDRNKVSWLERLWARFFGPTTVYKHFPEDMEIGVYATSEFGDEDECLKIVRWAATDKLHKVKIKFPVYRELEFIMDKEITVDIRRPISPHGK